MYAQGNVKRQKTAREVRTAESTECFTGIGKIEYKPDAPFNVDESFFYRHFNAAERIHGRPMEDWLRPSLYIGRAFTPRHGGPKRPWSDGSQSVDNYKKGIRAAFELCIKLGIKFWSGFDSDLAPAGDTMEETQKNLEQVVELINEYQQKTAIRPLWIGVDFKDVKYRNGALTNSEAVITICAAYQVKRMLDIANRLNAECFLLCGNREGYQNILNTDIPRELKYFGRFLKLVIEYRDKIGFRGQLLMQTVYDSVADECRYCNDLFSTVAFLKHCNYDRYYKLNVQPGHDFNMANVYGTVGSIDIRNTINISNATLLLRTLIENGGIHPGGINIYLPNHEGPFEVRDLAEAFVVTLDSLAKALRIAVRLVNDVQLNKSIQMRYISFATGWGAKLLGSEAKLEESEEQLSKQLEANAAVTSAPSRSEHWSSVLTRFIEAPLI